MRNRLLLLVIFLPVGVYAAGDSQPQSLPAGQVPELQHRPSALDTTPVPVKPAADAAPLGDQKVTEYRHQNRIVQMKITPKNAPSYYINNPAEEYRNAGPPGGIDDDLNMRRWKIGEW